MLFIFFNLFQMKKAKATKKVAKAAKKMKPMAKAMKKGKCK